MCTTLVFECLLHPRIISFHVINWLFVHFLNLPCFLYFEIIFADFTSRYFASKHGCHSTSQTRDTRWYKNRSRRWHFLYHLWSCNWNCWISNYQKCNRGIVQRFSNNGLCPVARRKGGIWIQTSIKKKKKKRKRKKTSKKGTFFELALHVHVITKGPFILRCNCVALPHCNLLHRNCDVTALRCRMKIKFILTWNAVMLWWLTAESNWYMAFRVLNSQI